MNLSRMIFLAGFAALGLAANIGLTQRVSAQSCQTDTDCPKGFVCQEAGGGDCASAPCADDGKECPEVKCDTTVYYQCVSGPCTADTDCAEGMVCMKSSSVSCTTAACVRGQDCPAIEPENCETVEESACVPKYEAPCKQDADCGEGFKCVESQMCWCSGSAGTAGGAEPAVADAGVASGSSPGSSGSAGSAEPGSAGSGAPVPRDADGGASRSEPSSECGCEPSGNFYCDMQEITCTTAADCPAGWSCEKSESPVTQVTCAVPAGVDGGATCSEVRPAEPAASQCVPPYYNTLGGSKGSVGEAATVSRDTANSGSVTGTTSTTTHQEAPKVDTGHENAADAGVTEDLGSSETKDEGHSDGGCQVALGQTGPAASWALLAALAGILGLRRRRAR